MAEFVCVKCGEGYHNKELPCFGNKEAKIHIYVSPAVTFNSGYYDKDSLSLLRVGLKNLFDKELEEVYCFVYLWGCLCAPRKAVIRECAKRYERVLRNIQEPELTVLFGSQVIRWKIMRGESLPNLRMNPGEIVRVTGDKRQYLLLSDSYCGESWTEGEKWRKTFQQGVERLLEQTRKIYRF